MAAAADEADAAARDTLNYDDDDVDDEDLDMDDVDDELKMVEQTVCGRDVAVVKMVADVEFMSLVDK